jgi:hypothetical protein
MDISVLDNGKYRKMVLTGVFCRPWEGRPDLERIHVLGLEIANLLMYTTHSFYETNSYGCLG